MGITPYETEVSPGIRKTVYMVVAEAINKYTGKRVQKKRRNVSSKPKAQLIYKELWAECREQKPPSMHYDKWGRMIEAYRENIDRKVRTESNPLGFSPHTVKCKHSRLTHTKLWAEKAVELITPAFVSDELDKFEAAGMSRQNANEVLKEIKCVFSFGISTGGLVANPFAGTRLRKVARKRLPALNHEEVGILLQEAKNRKHPFYHVWLLTIVLGLRRSELAGLQWIDIDFKQELVHLQRQLMPREGMVSTLKDWEDRLVAIPNHIIPVLKEMKLQSKSAFVIDIDSPEWRDGGQAKVLRQFCREIGIKELTHHRLRATHITLALADDVPLAIVKENVGHAQLSTTDKYFSSSGIKMRGQMDKLRVFAAEDTLAKVIPLKGK